MMPPLSVEKLHACGPALVAASRGRTESRRYRSAAEPERTRPNPAGITLPSEKSSASWGPADAITASEDASFSAAGDAALHE